MSEPIGTLERAASIAAESLKKIEAPIKAKAAEEAKVASDKAAVVEQSKKDEGIKLAAQAEAKAKEDERILTVEDKELSEPELVRKAELKETKRIKDESPDEKIKRVQEATQKRIDEIKSENMAKENKLAERLAALEAELAESKKPKMQEDALAKSKREEAERIARYVEEDKSKPKEERREMSEEELSEFYLEDPIKATRWIRRNELFREEEARKNKIQVEKPTGDAKELAKEFISKQIESRNKLLAKYPGITPTKEIIIEAKKEAGVPLDRILTESELEKVNSKIEEKSELFKLCREITLSDTKKYIESVDGPELVMAEMEKRLSGKSAGSAGKSGLTEEEIEAKIQAEVERRRLIDGEGITSTNGGKKVDNNLKTKSALQQKQLDIAKKAKISPEQLEKVIERRKEHSYMGGGEDKD